MKTLALLLLALLLAACGARPTAPAATPSDTPFQPAPALTSAPGAARTTPPASGLPPAVPPAPSAAPTPAKATPGVTPAEAQIDLFHRSGQTFLTWQEREDLSGEHYRVYRSSQPITADTLSQAQFLYQVGKNSARFYENWYRDQGIWGPRMSATFIFQKGQLSLRAGIGALVWTLAAPDFPSGQTSGAAYYAVTLVPAGGQEEFSPAYSAGPLDEGLADPLPVEISQTPGMKPGPGGHFYIQYMDLRHWNPTFHAPNPSNNYFGFDLAADPSVADALAYAYDYSVFEPTPEMCGGTVPNPLPVMVYLHGWRDNRYPSPELYDNASCAYGVYPIDQSQTWYFGFARGHDYRLGGDVSAGDVIENFTEQRVLRMVYDLLRDPPGPAVDPQRLYLIGHSMGGTGALAFAERYPNVFAAVYSGQPITDFRNATGASQDWPADVAIKWGAPALNLPIAISAPNGWANHLQKYNGLSVWDWENLQASLLPDGQPGAIPGRAADEFAPLAVDHGASDDVIPFNSQAQPLYMLLNASGRTWAGGITEGSHQWSVYGFLPPTLGKVNNTPFWDYQVIRDETTPGFANLSSNIANPPTGPTAYNQTIHWSASWAAWDGAPIDEPTRWQISLCAVAAGMQQCGTGSPQTVDVTPRRVQQFVITPGAQYTWEARAVGDNQPIAAGTVTASPSGTLTVPGVPVSPSGVRLQLRPAG